LTQPEANAINALLANQAQTVGYLRALATALYKADLAANAERRHCRLQFVSAAGSFQASLFLQGK
jgi:hypothetical protein